MSFLPIIMWFFFYIMIHTTGDLVLGSARPTLLTTCCQGWLHSLSHLLYASNIFHTLFYRLFYCHFLLFFCTHFFPLFLLLLNPHVLLFFTLFSFHFSQEKNRFKTERNPFQVKPAVGQDRKWWPAGRPSRHWGISTECLFEEICLRSPQNNYVATNRAPVAMATLTPWQRWGGNRRHY